MLIERSFNTGSVTINYAEGPDSGPPLVLLHGLPGRWQEFTPVLPALILQWHMYALDYRGQGKSGRSPGRYASRYYIEDIEAFLQQLGEPAILFGVSAGGMVALGVAARNPEMVRGIILGDSPIDMDVLLAWMSSEGFQDYFSTLRQKAGMKESFSGLKKALGEMLIQVAGKDELVRYEDSPGVDPVDIQQLAMTLYQMDPSVLDYHAAGHPKEFLAGFVFEEILEKIECPLLLLQANPSLGGMLTDSAVQQVQSILPDVTHVMLETVGHDLGLDSWNTSPLLRAVMIFLETIRETVN